MIKKRRLTGIIALVVFITSAYAQYTETMDPDGLTKNLKDDYGLVDDDAASDQSEKLRSAISELNALGGGRIIIPKGAYTLSSIRLMSDVHILIEAGTVIKPAPDNGVVFLLSTESGRGPDHIKNVSVRGIGGSFIVDYQHLKLGDRQRAFIAKMVSNFLISDMDVKDNYTTYCGITLAPTKGDDDISDWEISRATNGTIRNIRHFRASPGYGLVQCHGAQSVNFENLYSHGGVALRLESGANTTHVGLYDLSAKNITCVNGRSGVMLGPHSAKNGVVTVDGVKTISCSYAVQFGDGGVKEDAPDQTPGYFSDSSSITNIHAVFGLYSQVKGSKFLALPTSDYYELMKIWPDEKFFDAPSIGGVFNGASTYTVNIENVTMEGFEYFNDKPILTEEDSRPGKWGNEKTSWINTHQGDQWRTLKSEVIKDYKIDDYLFGNPPELSPNTINSSGEEDESFTISLSDVINDPDVDPLPVTSVSGPSNGRIQISGINITYSPDPDFYGRDTVVYEVFDYETPPKRGEGSIIITINSVNDSPELNNTDLVYEVKKDTSAFNIPVSDSIVSDPDCDSLIITIQRDPGNGAATVDEAGNIIYVPDPGFEGKDTILFTACDRGSPVQCVSGTIIIIVVASGTEGSVSAKPELRSRNKLTVYPNPADNLIHVNGIFLNSTAIGISVFDTSGKEVYQNLNLQSNGHSVTLPLPRLPRGYYTIRIISDQSVGLAKVMVL